MDITFVLVQYYVQYLLSAEKYALIFFFTIGYI